MIILLDYRIVRRQKLSRPYGPVMRKTESHLGFSYNPISLPQVFEKNTITDIDLSLIQEEA